MPDENSPRRTGRITKSDYNPIQRPYQRRTDSSTNRPSYSNKSSAPGPFDYIFQQSQKPTSNPQHSPNPPRSSSSSYSSNRQHRTFKSGQKQFSNNRSTQRQTQTVNRSGSNYQRRRNSSTAQPRKAPQEEKPKSFNSKRKVRKVNPIEEQTRKKSTRSASQKAEAKQFERNRHKYDRENKKVRNSKGGTADGSRQKINRQKRAKQKASPILYLSVVVGILFCVFAVLLFTVLLPIESYVVERDNNMYSEDEIFQLAGISIGDNLLRAKTKNASKNIEKCLPYVLEAKVVRKFPNTISITTTSTKQKFLVKTADSFVWLSEEGKVLETQQRMPKLRDGQILVSGLNDERTYSLGEFVSPNDFNKPLFEAIKKISTASAESKFEIKKINFLGNDLASVVHQKHYVIYLNITDESFVETFARIKEYKKLQPNLTVNYYYDATTPQIRTSFNDYLPLLKFE